MAARGSMALGARRLFVSVSAVTWAAEAKAAGETADYRYSWKRQNWFDYARTNADQQEQGGGAGGLAGDNFERPLFSVEGGLGLFGSASADSVGFVVVPRR